MWPQARPLFGKHCRWVAPTGHHDVDHPRRSALRRGRVLGRQDGVGHPGRCGFPPRPYHYCRRQPRRSALLRRRAVLTHAAYWTQRSAGRRADADQSRGWQSGE
eukprot:8919349-Lingulodinium_polyedra.AAC.1